MPTRGEDQPSPSYNAKALAVQLAAVVLLVAVGCQQQQSQDLESLDLEERVAALERATARSQAASVETPTAVSTSTDWVELDSHPGCYVWNLFLQPTHSMDHIGTPSNFTWSGACSDERADGTGQLVFAWEADAGIPPELVYTGTLASGKIETGIESFRYATSYWSTWWMNGRKHGPDVVGTTSGSVTETPYVQGKRHGIGVWVHWQSGEGTLQDYVEDKEIRAVNITLDH